MTDRDESGPGPGSLLQPIQARVLREEVLDTLRREILTGQLAAGARVVEEEVADRMGTSRVPVREAIRQLAQEGLLELASHRGAVVAALRESELDACYQIRAVIEAEAMRRACSLVTPAGLARLERLCADMEHAVRMSDIDDLAELDRRFHEAVLDVSDFGVVRRVWRSVDGLIRVRNFGLFHDLAVLTDGDLAVIADQHRALVQALAAGDPDQAARAASEHVLAMRERAVGQ